jgi:hypothetical protein
MTARAGCTRGLVRAPGEPVNTGMHVRSEVDYLTRLVQKSGACAGHTSTYTSSGRRSAGSDQGPRSGVFLVQSIAEEVCEGAPSFVGLGVEFFLCSRSQCSSTHRIWSTGGQLGVEFFLCSRSQKSQILGRTRRTACSEWSFSCAVDRRFNAPCGRRSRWAPRSGVFLVQSIAEDERRRIPGLPVASEWSFSRAVERRDQEDEQKTPERGTRSGVFLVQSIAGRTWRGWMLASSTRSGVFLVQSIAGCGGFIIARTPRSGVFLVQSIAVSAQAQLCAVDRLGVEFFSCSRSQVIIAASRGCNSEWSFSHAVDRSRVFPRPQLDSFNSEWSFSCAVDRSRRAHRLCVGAWTRSGVFLVQSIAAQAMGWFGTAAGSEWSFSRAVERSYRHSTRRRRAATRSGVFLVHSIADGEQQQSIAARWLGVEFFSCSRSQ